MIMFYTLEKFGCGFFPLVKKPPNETTFVENNYISTYRNRKSSERSTAGASTPPVRYESKCKPNISPVSSGKPWESVQLFWLLRYYVQEY